MTELLVCAPLKRNLSARRIPGLDGLRAISVLLVIGYHAGIVVPAAGGNGVTLFFVLSGFLITRLLVLEESRAGSISLKDFYARRTLRIVPAFYGYCALVLLLLTATHKAIDWHQLTASLLFVNNYYQALFGDPNTAFSHTWSLAVEEQFYLLWPGLFLLLRSRGDRLRACGVLMMLVWIQRAIRAFILHTPDGYIYEAFDTRIDSLLAGCAMALLVSAPAGLERADRLFCAPWKLGVTVALLALSTALQGWLPRWYREAIGFTTDPVLMAILILQVNAFVEQPLLSWLEWSWVRYLGRISYPLYLYQQIVVGSVEKRIEGLPAPLVFTAVLTSSVIAASASYFIIEKPALRLKQRFQRVR
jgi:peptidoglycan/LPS O-acetylase OafA/YrhL